jgi:DNA-binding LytR/AlgR family response regulator
LQRLRVFIVDDEPLAIDRLRHGLARLPNVEVVGATTDSRTAAEAIAAAAPDLVLLDIQMPALNGMELAAALDSLSRPEVVFVTAFQDFAVQAFELDAVDYLLKPFDFERLAAAIDRAQRRRTAPPETVVAASAQAAAQNTDYETSLWAPVRDGMASVRVASIEWVEAAGDYAMIHTSTRSYLLRITLTELSRRLDPAVIRRVHRSAMVQLEGVKEIRRTGGRRTELVLSCGVTVPVGEAYRDGLLAALRLDEKAK